MSKPESDLERVHQMVQGMHKQKREIQDYCNYMLVHQVEMTPEALVLFEIISNINSSTVQLFNGNFSTKEEASALMKDLNETIVKLNELVGGFK